MNTQHTKPEVITNELQTVRDLTGSHNITYNDTGWDSRVYSVDDGKYYFKFPRSEKIRSRYTQEIAALHIAKDIGLVRTPEVHWQHPDNLYFGYAGVPGHLLAEVTAQLDSSQKQQIGWRIGEFLQAFHAKPLPGARMRSLDAEIAQFQAFYEPAVPIIKRTYTPTEQLTLHTLVYDTWPEAMRSLGEVDVLSHGDLHLNNMLFDQKSGVGIIDFGDVALCDESRDFIDLEDPEIERSILEAYGQTDLLQQKIEARKPVIQLISLTYHIKKGHTAKVAQHLASIRQYL